MDDQPVVCILAGGLGKRLGTLTEEAPKPMVPIGDRPFLQVLMEHFASLGWCRFALAVSHLWEQIRDHFGDGGRFGWEIEYSVEPEPLGTGGAVLWAQPLWGRRAVVTNGDTFLAEDWRELLKAHEAANAPVTIALAEKDDCARYGMVEVQDGRIAGFTEKDPDAGPGWINAGTYVLEAEALAAFERGKSFSLETDVFPTLLGEMAAYFCRSEHIDIGTPQSLAAFRDRPLQEKKV